MDVMRFPTPTLIERVPSPTNKSGNGRRPSPSSQEALSRILSMQMGTRLRALERRNQYKQGDIRVDLISTTN